MARKVIDGLLYDTDTAKLVHAWESDLPANDLDYVSEGLYCTPNGVYFLHGEGGPRTSYARQTGSNRFSGGEGFAVLTPDEALAWLEAREADADTIAEYFTLPEA